MMGAIAFKDEKTYERSAAKPSVTCGVPTQMKCTSQSEIAERAEENERRPVANSLCNNS